LESTVRQTVLSPLELSEEREQKVTVIEELPYFPYAGLRGNELLVIDEGRWTTVALGQDLRDDVRGDVWGRSALIPLGYFDRDKIYFSSKAPPSGWLRDELQPVK
jgi:hypothetical protein